MRERLFRVLDYMIPVSSAVEYSHLVRNICHRDIKPANILIGLPDPNLRGATLQVRLADFNVAKLSDDDVHFGMTQMKTAVPGTLFFQSPEQETNIIEILVNVQQGLPEVEYFEDFYIQIAKNDSFSLFNRDQQYPVLYADRARKRLVLGRPYRETSETNVRARIQKSVGRPADVYSLGATFYYLISSTSSSSTSAPTRTTPSRRISGTSTASSTRCARRSRRTEARRSRRPTASSPTSSSWTATVSSSIRTSC
jgi:serine/threonine protein kinase